MPRILHTRMLRSCLVRTRTIDKLRKKFPDIEWTFDARRSVWNGSDGSEVRRTCQVCDDNAGPIELWRYFDHKDGKAPEWIA